MKQANAPRKASPYRVRVQHEDFDLSAEVQALRDGNAGIGAVASFVGLVRDLNEAQQVAVMELEHYPGMTERAISKIIDTARERWRLLGVNVIHRVGKLHPTEQIVLVAVASAHRGDAFEACNFIMDFLKTEAPIWKKESTPAGHDQWVSSRSSDASAAQRWQR
jgi:molybdopterin synthase catalytic subunit